MPVECGIKNDLGERGFLVDFCVCCGQEGGVRGVSGLSEKCLLTLRLLQHLVSSWWCCLGGLGGAVLLEEMWFGERALRFHASLYSQFALSAFCLFEDVISQIPVLPVIPAACCPDFLLQWTLVLLEP